jgi:diguanylate cyclase (GGDEF)-like protein/PAS domain S-box-containing protein
MSLPTLYFSTKLTSCKAQLASQLSAHGYTVEWQPVERIDDSPVSSIILLSENDLKATDGPLLASRKTIIIVEKWSMEASIEWIKRGAVNCFSHDDEHTISWLISKLSQFALARSDRPDDDVLQVIIDAIPVPLFFKDHLHIYRGCNTAFCQFIGFAREKIIGHSVYDVAPKHLADAYHEADCQLLAKGGTQYYEAEVRFADGTTHEIEFNKAVFTDSNGQALGQVGVMLDITERNQLMRQLDKATRTDPLTGAANRREFDLIIHDEIKQQKNSNVPLSLMTLDVDFFKHINDRFGHGGGDQALQLIAEWLHNHLRSTDKLFRIGGEEFYILMQDTDIHSAFKMAENICKGVSTNTFLIKQQEVRITLSIGVIELDPMIELEHTLEMVDRALYDAKFNGRNCVCPVYPS